MHKVDGLLLTHLQDLIGQGLIYIGLQHIGFEMTCPKAIV